MLHAGSARRDITPPVGTPCALGLDNEALEVLDPIYLRAVALGDGSTQALILAADVIGLYRYADQTVRRRVTRATGVPLEAVILHATHTHQSPNIRVQNGEFLRARGLVSYSPEFWTRFQAAAVEAATEALADLRPAVLHYGEANVRRIAGNRRLRQPDGSIVMRGSRDDSEQRRAYPEGYIDPLVRTLRFGREEGDIVLANYCCHPTATGGDEGPYITADFPGYALAEVEAALPGSAGIYLTGPCGNVNPGKYTGTRSRQSDAFHMGHSMAQAILCALADGRPVAGDALRLRSQEVLLPLRDSLPSEQELKQSVEESLAAYSAAKERGESMPGGGPLLRALCRLHCRRHAQGDFLPAQVTSLEWGDVLLFALPGECFLEIDHTIRGHYINHRVICAENCDYTASYIPVPEAYLPEAQGYEGRVAHVAPEAFGTLATAACEVWDSPPRRPAQTAG